jgi:hypothetical protein
VAREGDVQEHGRCLMPPMSVLDPDEVEMMRWAVVALRRRADRQEKLAKDGTAYSEDGSPIRTGEAAIAVRVSMTLAELASEFELELSAATVEKEHAHGNG